VNLSGRAFKMAATANVPTPNERETTNMVKYLYPSVLEAPVVASVTMFGSGFVLKISLFGMMHINHVAANSPPRITMNQKLLKNLENTLYSLGPSFLALT